MGYRNVDIRTGDGTLGVVAAGPFEAILVAAAGPEVPAPLKTQLAIGGRLFMPIDGTSPDEHQHLIKVVRVDESAYDTEVLGAVSFVPLIGKHGWAKEPAASGE